MKKIIVATLGNCVHVAGVTNYLNLAEKEGYDVEFLGIGLSVDEIIQAICEKKPNVVGLSYRLTPEPLNKILEGLKDRIKSEELEEITWLFGGTEPTAKVAEKWDMFDKIFYGSEDIDEVVAYIKGKEHLLREDYQTDLVSRIKSKYPYPILRHHLGLSTVEKTVNAIEEIANAKVIDVISVAPDQNAQEFFFDQENMDQTLNGAGGVPVRNKDDLRKLFNAAQRGNYPLLRAYSGTKNIIPFAEVLQESIQNAWCAIPLFWYSELDKRGPRKLEDAIIENQQVMAWHGERNIPVEVNDSHQWSLRDAHDAVAVAVAYIAAYNAKKMGVKDYIAQFMFNVPASIYPEMDLAKMLAKIELIESLVDDNFSVYRQARAGLASFPANLYQAKGQLAASAYLAMAINPHIYHVVGFCEAQYAAEAKDIIESAMIVRGVVNNKFHSSMDLTKDSTVQERKTVLIQEAKEIISAIKSLNTESNDPLTDPEIIVEAVRIGILDAPQLKGMGIAKGEIKIRLVNGALYAYDEKAQKIIPESERLKQILENRKTSNVKCLPLSVGM